MIPLSSLRIGPAAELAPGVQSGIDKRPAGRVLLLGPTGFAGDEQADLRRHGGPEKAVHHYDAGHYPVWRAELGDLPALRPGGFGENLSTLGLSESDVAVGDVFRLGSALIEVSQARQPCWKLNLRFDRRDMARLVQQTGRSGWYYRVLEPGEVAPDDALALVERRAPDWTLTRLHRVLYIDRQNRAELQAMASLAPLSPSWRDLAARRLDSGRVEDWQPRLDG
ncbi:MOSC domain-containing protein [Paracoccus alkenifer]|uniref:MOSC domain-containing protein YiiM n=1 Tax=Paracoccus alkenifer TaxID=65735 RepID=A0A1H6KXA3_9RHOB|nr:MOSC domain-containing protein [Paracoccus alkenifer]SEH80434.1 MOSC domain-containing protein YiiM [Paracoccus alkenifer]